MESFLGLNQQAELEADRKLTEGTTEQLSFIDKIIAAHDEAIGSGSLMEESAAVDGVLMNTASSPELTMAQKAAARAQEEAAKREYIKKPEVQAQIIYENYLRNTDIIFTGPEKRKLRREILANAKKGRYKKMFDEEFIQTKITKQ